MAINVNLEIPPDPSLPDGFVRALNDRMRQITMALKTQAATVPANSTQQAATRPSAASSSPVAAGSSATILQGSHSQRNAQDPTSLTAGTLYAEIDRGALYVAQASGSTQTWALVVGFYADQMAARPSDLAAADKGFLFYAADRSVLYYFDGTGWLYLSGIMRDILQNQPIGLTMYDRGLLFCCTTGTGGVAYNHIVRWNGTMWTPADGETLGGYVTAYLKPPTEPGWQLCDGSATHYLDIVSGVLTEVAFTVPTTAGTYFRR